MSLFGPSEEQLKLQEEARKRAAQYEEQYGPAPEEAGLEEGDLSDYVLPFKGIGKALTEGGMKAAVKMAAKESGEVAKRKGVGMLKDKMPEKPKPTPTSMKKENTLRYDEINKMERKPDNKPIDYSKLEKPKQDPAWKRNIRK